VLLRSGIVYQEWINAGNASSKSGDLSFFGLSVTAGLSF
jgi:hypothetical protein